MKLRSPCPVSSLAVLLSLGVVLPSVGCGEDAGSSPVEEAGGAGSATGGSSSGGELVVGSGGSGLTPAPEEPYVIPGELYYVDATAGSDDNPGTSTEPFRTLAHALEQVAGGDGILLRDGDYGDLTFGANGGLAIPVVFDDWVTIKPDEGHSPTLHHVELGTWGSETSTDAIPFTTVGNSDLRLRLDGLTIEDRVQIRGSRYVDVRNCVIRSDGELTALTTELVYGVQVMNGQHVQLLGNEITHSGVGVEAMTTDFVMKGNDIHHNTHDGLKVYGGANWLVEGNTFRELDDGLDDDDPDPDGRNMHVDGIHVHTIIHEGGFFAEKYAGAARNLVFRGNLLYHIESMGVMINQNDSGIGDYEDFTWENNVFGPTGGILFIQGSSFVGHFIFRHNTVLYTPGNVWTSIFGREMRPEGLDDPGSMPYFIQVWGNPAEHQYYNNIFTIATALTQEDGLVTHNLFIGPDDVGALPYTAIPGTIADFVEAGGTFGELVAGSPAIDAGTTEAASPAADIYGRSRDAAPDLGAVEHE